jgi:PAS domain S-box-containing protein
MSTKVKEYQQRITQLEKRVQQLQLQLARQHTENATEVDQIYQQLVNYLSDYIYTVRVKDGEVIETIHGPGCVAVTGYNSEDYIKEPELWYSMVHEDDRDAVTEQSSTALKGKDVLPLEHRIIHRDGSIRWVRNTILLLHNPSGELYAYNGLINDITAQKAAQFELLQSEEKYRSLTNDVLESSRVGISILDADLNVVWVNKAYSDYLGVRREHILGNDARELVKTKLALRVANSREFLNRILLTYKSNTTVERLECHVLPADGLQERWLDYWSRPIRSGLYLGGRIEHFTDITEQKRVLDEVIESERRYSQLLHHLTDYVYSVKVQDGQPIYTYHGQGSLAVTGYTQEDFAINPDLWIDMVHPDDQKAVREHARKALLGESSKPLDHRIIHKNGSQRWVKSTIVHQKNTDDQVISYDGLISDITELKEAEDRDRLTHQQLIQADKMATLGILVSGVAHEINNPNNFIMLNAKMIEKAWSGATPLMDSYYRENGDYVIAGMPYSVAKDKISELISGISKGAVRIENIVRGLKNYATQDPGEMNQDVDLNKVIEAAILIVNNLIKKSTDLFDVNYWHKLPIVRGSFLNLEQVLINLITNSCQALSKTPAPRIIKINTFYDSYRKQVRAQITDSGKGIDEHDMKHIFDPFFTTKRESGGTGLGLSIAYNIVREHGGNLQFESKNTGGTTATLSLPVILPHKQKQD